MTINETIAKQKATGNKKISRVWICPNIVKQPKTGKMYVYNGSIETKPPKGVGDRNCKNHWIEDGTLCMIYQDNDDPIIFT